jgi:hypothetical protein
MMNCDGEFNDPFLWWKDILFQLTILAKLAKEYLASI